MQTRTRGHPLDWRIGGTLLGLLLTVAVGLQGPLGVSSAYVTTDARVVEAVAPGAARSTPYLASFAALSPEWFGVIGIVLGALLASRVWRSTGPRDLPRAWRARFGGRRAWRFAASFGAGFLLLFGARLAGGCTSGHVISGLSQLAVSGFVFGAAVFAAGIPTALILYGRRSS